MILANRDHVNNTDRFAAFGSAESNQLPARAGDHLADAPPLSSLRARVLSVAAVRCAFLQSVMFYRRPVAAKVSSPDSITSCKRLNTSSYPSRLSGFCSS